MKIRYWLIFYIFILCAFALVGCSQAQTLIEPAFQSTPIDEPVYNATLEPCLSPLLDSSQIGVGAKFSHFTSEEGLSNSTIRAIYQDHYGFIWIGTEDGLNRYDGYEFVVFQYDPEDPNSLGNNIVTDILEDDLGNMWIGTESGLYRFDRKQSFTHIQASADGKNAINHQEVSRIYEDSVGRLWVGTWGGGLYLVDRKSGKTKLYQNEFKNLTSLGCDRVGDILEDGSGLLWVGTCNGLDRFDPLTGVFTHYGYVPNDPESIISSGVRSMAMDSSGILWIGTSEGGVDRFDPESGIFSHFQYNQWDISSLSDNRVWTVMVDSADKVWIGTSDGLNQYVEQTDSFIRYQVDVDNPDHSESILNALVYDIFEDRSGLIWVGTESGLSVYSSLTDRFAHFKHDSELPFSVSSNMVRGFIQDDEGTLWIATDYGINRYDSGLDRFMPYHHDPLNVRVSLSSNLINTIYQDSQGVIWAGTAHGLDQYDRENDQFRPYPAQFLDQWGSLLHLSQVPVSMIWEDSQEQLWIGTKGYGLVKLSALSISVPINAYEESKTESLSSVSISTVLEDSDGSLWVGTLDQGVAHFNPTSGETIFYNNDPELPDSISSDTVSSMLIDNSNRLWVGTDAGLNLFRRNTGTFTHYRERDGLPNDMVNGILQDSAGYLWISTNQGLSRFNSDDESFKTFKRPDGLQSNEFNMGAAYKGVNGELYFGGINGFNVFCPQSIENNTFVPPVYLTNITQGGEPVAMDKAFELATQVTLSWPKNYFEFEYAALNYVQSENNQYSYRLEDFEDNWNLVGNKRYGRYTNLPGGKYWLHITGSNNDGVWNDQGLSVRIIVKPVFWETNWFRYGGVILLIALVITGYRWRVFSVEKANRMLSQQVALRTQEIVKRQEAAESLRQVMILLNSNRSLEDTLGFIICQVNRLLLVNRSCMFRLDENGHAQMMPGIAYDCEGTKGEQSTQRIGDLFAGGALEWVVEQVRDISTFRQIDHLDQFLDENPQYRMPIFEEMKTLIAIPIQVDNRLFGGMLILFGDKRKIQKEDLTLLNMFTEQAVLAVGNAQLREQAEELAVVSERNRLARELHDAVTQTLFSASLIAEALPTLWQSDPKEGEQLLDELRQLNRGALAEMRTLLMELRPSGVLDTRLVDLLQQLAEAVIGRSGMGVKLEVKEVGKLPDDVHIGLYRICQEALTNVMKHAKASEVILRLNSFENQASIDYSFKEIEVILEVCDNGCGFDPERHFPDHYGLVNMHERAQAMGARLDIFSQKGSGTTIRVTWRGKAVDHE